MSSGVKTFLPVLSGALLLVLAACGGTGPRVAAPEVQESPGIDWMHPDTRDSIQVSSFEEAEAVVGYPLLVPRLGPPDAIYVSDPAKIPADELSVGLAYLHHPAGPFWMLEIPNPVGPDWKDNYDNLVAQCAAYPGCGAQMSVVHIRGGIRAWLTVDADSTMLLWQEGDLQIRLGGPLPSFSPDVALRIAEEL
jgi:hypothetical protein